MSLVFDIFYNFICKLMLPGVKVSVNLLDYFFEQSPSNIMIRWVLAAL